MPIEPSCRPCRAGGYCVEINDWTSIDILTRQLDLCGVAPGTSCVILLDASSDAAVGESAALAARRLGADTASVASPVSAPSGGQLSDGLLGRLVRGADLVVDLTVPGIASMLASAPDDPSPAGPKILAAGGLDVARLHRLRPHSGLIRRAERAAERFRGGSVLELTSGFGTDIAIQLADGLLTSETGIVDPSRPVAVWPGGRIEIAPAGGTTTGTLIAMPRDLLVDVASYIRSPLTLSIRNDHIADVSGSAGDADLLRSLLGSTGSIDGFGIASVGLGLSLAPVARTAPQSFAPHVDPRDALLAAGSISLTFGPNPNASRLGGEPVTIVVDHHSLAIDGRPLVVDGELQGDIRPDVYEAAGT
jgi:2,5-dihydroxypyridine 5,6-dioxygenase